MTIPRKIFLLPLLILLVLAGMLVLYVPDPVDAITVDVFHGNIISPFTVELQKGDASATVGKRFIFLGATGDDHAYILVIGNKDMYIKYSRWLLGGFMWVDYRYEIKKKADKKKLMKLYERYISDKAGNQKDSETD